MKNIIVTALLLFTTFSFAQSTVMIAILLEDNKENEYLEKEKNWNIAAQAMVDNGMIAQWSVWKRTPREGDENWAQYYVFRRTTAEQDKNENNLDNWKKIVYGAFKEKNEETIDEMLGFDGVFKDRRERKFKWVASTGWRGLEWEIGDKAYFHFMTQKNDDFVAYENAVWKPIAQQQILDGYRKFWGLGEIISKDEATKALKSSSTHIAFNFMTKKKNDNELEDPADFLSKKNWEGLRSSRDMMPAEELTLIYSTF